MLFFKYYNYGRFVDWSLRYGRRFDGRRLDDRRLHDGHFDHFASISCIPSYNIFSCPPDLDSDSDYGYALLPPPPTRPPPSTRSSSQIPDVVTNEDLVDCLKGNDRFYENSIIETLKITGLRRDEVSDSFLTSS